MNKNKKKIMHSFKLNFISAVNNPAQEGAQMVLLKRASSQPVEVDNETAKIEKIIAITKTTLNHSHLVDNDNQLGGETSYAFLPDNDYSHSHPFIISNDGDVVVGEADGHTHDIAQISKDGTNIVLSPEIQPLEKEEPMTDEEKSLVDTLQKSVERSEAIALLSDVQKSHFQTLTGEESNAFLALGKEERELAIKSLQGEDPVIYTDKQGIDYRKSDDPRMVALAKRSDENENKVEIEKAARLNAQLSKQAQDDLNHYPGDDLTKTELLRAVSGIENSSTRNDVFDMLKANNESLGKAFETLGTEEGIVEKSGPESELEKLADAYAKEHGVGNSIAYNAVLGTPQGSSLYGQL